MKQLGEDISAYLTDKGVDKVLVRQYRGPGGTSAGVRIRQSLEESLRAHNVQVAKLSAPFILDGTYKSELAARNMVAVIQTNVYDNNMNPMGTFEKRVITSEQDIIELFGLTMDRTTALDDIAASNGGTAAQQEQASLANVLSQAQATPSGSIDTPRRLVQPAADSFFSMQLVRILPDKTEEVVEVSSESGLSLADLRRDDRFVVRVFNDSPYDVAVQLSLDGVNMFAFSENPNFRRNGIYYVLRESRGTLEGWHKNAQEYFEFQVTPTDQGVAARLGTNTAEVGTITAIIREAWTPDENRDLAFHRKARLQNAKNAIGVGPLKLLDKPQPTTARVLGEILASISVRYPQTDDLPE